MLTLTPRRRALASASLAGVLVLIVACGGGGAALATPTAAPQATDAPPTTVAAATAPPSTGGPQVVQAAGDIAAAVDQYRALLGDNNGGDPGAKPAGRREINWDAVPDEQSAPNDYPPDFFNASAAPRARGILFSTPGTSLQVSAGANNPTSTPLRFGNINPTYPDIFKAFSPEKLFSPLGSNIVDLTFFVPGTQTPALVRGFGAVYTDVDTDHTAYEYFDANGASLGRFSVPAADNGLSFLGVAFDTPVVARVRVEYGTVALGPNDDATNDVAVMDDFIYGEPQANPAPVTATKPPAAAGFSLFSTAVNRDTNQAARDPGLAVGAATSGAPANLWLTWSENSGEGQRQIFVDERVGEAFEPRGASLNIHQNVIAQGPRLAFAGENRIVPWAAWYEPSPSFGDVNQIFASRFAAAGGLWQPAGQDRGGNEPSLNHNTKREAVDPFIFSGSGDPTKAPLPWVTWLEESSASNFVQVFVAKAVKDDAAIGGFRWDFVGENRANNEPTLNVNSKLDADHPTGVFAETGNAVPWVVWHEFGIGQIGLIFSARGVADAKAPGGFKWVNVPACAEGQTACALNLNPLKDASDASLAAGSLNAGEAAVPWIAWVEVGPTGKHQVVVSRLDTNTRNSFLAVGGSLNVDQNHDASHPAITFVGNVPYVAWLEDDGSGHASAQLRHLASDPQTGTWQLDSPAGGLRRAAGVNQTGLFAAPGADSLFLAWTEGDPDAEAAQVLAGAFKP